MNTYWLSLIICCGIISSTGLYASRDNAHYYRATNFFGEPRFEKPWLGTFDFYASYGSTSTGFNGEGKKVPLLDIYGPYNMLQLGVGVPGKDLSTIPDIVLEELTLIPSQGCFGQLSFDGKFKLTELNAFFIQNLNRGFFLQLHIPARFITMDNICYCDLSPDNCQEPNKNNPIWQAFLANSQDIFAQYCVKAYPVHERGVGDISLELGWTLNYQETDVLDFVDFTIKSGFLFASSPRQDPNLVFAVPIGYNGHSGIPLSLEAAFGTYDWLTIGGHFGALFLLSDCHNVRMKTSVDQSGLIKLAQGRAKVDKGTIWEAEGYFKADHIVRGFSLLFAYSFVTEGKDTLTPQKCSLFCPDIVNTDASLASWNMHTIHARAEYDFTKEHSRVGTRITFFYDFPISGKRIFRTGMVGGHCGIDIAWQLD
jgi:hypothetical protein